MTDRATIDARAWAARRALWKRAERAFFDPLQLFLDDRDADWHCEVPPR